LLLAESHSASAPARAAFSNPSLIFVADTSFVADLFDLKEAEILYKAAATLLASIDDLQKQLVDVTG
jgi:hypothetical protein